MVLRRMSSVSLNRPERAENGENARFPEEWYFAKVQSQGSVHSMSAASLRALLAKSIDYAGMFPPCSLALEPALQNHANYVRSSDAWMLGAFVLSIEQFDAARQLLSLFDPLHPLRVAALGPKTANADAFLEAVEKADTAIRWLSSNVDLVSISHLEMFLPHNINLASLEEARSLLGDLPVFWEAPPDRAQQTIAL